MCDAKEVLVEAGEFTAGLLLPKFVELETAEACAEPVRFGCVCELSEVLLPFDSTCTSA